MIYLLPILALILYVGILRLLGPGQSTVKKGRHYPRLIDTLLLKGAFPLRNVWFWGPIEGSFVVTQAMVDAVAWTDYTDGRGYDYVCQGDSSKIIGRTAGLRLPTRGSVRLAYRYASSERMEGFADWMLKPGIELMAMGHDPKQGGKMIFESLGTAKVGDEVVASLAAPYEHYGAGTLVSVSINGSFQKDALLPIDTRFGFPQGHHQGGDCPALNDVAL